MIRYRYEYKKIYNWSFYGNFEDDYVLADILVIVGAIMSKCTVNCPEFVNCLSVIKLVRSSTSSKKQCVLKGFWWNPVGRKYRNLKCVHFIVSSSFIYLTVCPFITLKFSWLFCCFIDIKSCIFYLNEYLSDTETYLLIYGQFIV